MIENDIAQLNAEPALRFEAATRLCEYNDTPEQRARAIAALIGLLPDGDHKVQYAAFSGLVKIEASEAFMPMLGVLLDQPESRVWGLLKLTIGMRLRNALLDMTPTGDAALADRLNAAIDAPTMDVQQRALLVRLLGRTGDMRFVEPLIDRLVEGDIVSQGAAAEALGRIGDTRALAPLMLFLDQGEDERVREIAVTALGQLHDLRAFDPLLALLGDPSEWVRAAAATALAELGDRRAVEPISALLHDENTMVVDAAFDALKRFSYEKLDLGVTNGADAAPPHSD